MPRREWLTGAERRTFTTFPDLDERDLVRHYTVDDDTFHLARHHRGRANPLGFTVQLLTLAHLGFSSDAKINPNQAVIDFVADQLGLHPGHFNRYAPRRATRNTHFAEARDYLGLRTVDKAAELELTAWLSPLAMSTTQGLPLVHALIAELRSRRHLVPTIHVVERLVATALTRAARDTCALLLSGVPPATLERLDGLLTPEAGRHETRHAWLRQPPGRPSQRSFLHLLKRLEFIRALRLDPDAARTVHQNRLRQLAREGAQLAAHHLEDFEPQRRRATIVATLLDRRETLTDAALDMHDRLVTRMFRNAKLKRDAMQLKRGKSINDKVVLFEGVGRALIEARASHADPFEAIEAVVPWTEFVSSVADAKTLAQPKAFDAMHLLKGEAKTLRGITYALFDAFVFNAAPNALDVVEAIARLRDLKARHKRKLPADLPSSFVGSSWRALVYPHGRDAPPDRTHYELCVHSALQNGLRSGDIWVDGSRKYRDFDTYLLPRRVWTPMLEAAERGDTPLPLTITPDFDAYWDARVAQLERDLGRCSAASSAASCRRCGSRGNGWCSRRSPRACQTTPGRCRSACTTRFLG
ncbi:MAG: DUF4158 domain-containing protein [Pleurocapsa sp. SU_196_0]|nr:DUF4158 domain-containing protein [Pleurocapsa sp. SU_196_0]